MNDGSKRDDREPGSDPPSETPDKLVKPEPATVLPPEVLQSTRSRLDPNVVLVKVTQRADPAHMVEQTRAMLDAFYEDDRRQIEIYKARVDAVISAKERDPDEIEKRKANKIRRWLKLYLAGGSGVALTAGILTAALGGNFVLAVLLLTIGGVVLTLLLPLASGESVTAADVRSVISAMRPQLAADDSKRENKERVKNKGKKR